VANDYGYLTRKQRERERLRRARKRAGVPVRGENAAQKAGRQEDGSFYTAAGARRAAESTKWTPAPKPYPKRKATAATKRISADYQEALRRPVRGEDARDKARVGKQTRAREAFEAVTTAKTPADRKNAKVAFAKSLIGLTAAEKRDLGSYSGAFSRRQQQETLRKNTSVPDEVIGAVLGVRPSEALWSYTHPRERLRHQDQSGPALTFFPLGRVARKPVDGPLGGGGGGVRSRAEIEAEIEAIKADPNSWDHRNGGRFLKGHVAERFDELVNERQRMLGQVPASAEPPRRVRRTAPPTGTASVRAKTKKQANVPGAPPSSSNVEDAAKAARPAMADDIVGAMPAARRARAAQEALRTPERAKRAARGEAAAARAGGGQAGLRASRGEMRGELPKLPFGKLVEEYGKAGSEMRARLQPDIDEALNFIREHPSHSGREYKITNTQEALLKALDGATPTKAEVRDLTEVFGEDVADAFRWRHAYDKAIKVVNVPRALMSSYDLSRMFRQDLVMFTRHPVVVGRNVKYMIRAGTDPKKARAIQEELQARPRFDQAIEDGLAVTDFRGPTKNIEEDLLGADYAGKLPIVGPGVRFSSRAYNVGGAKNRMDLYDLLMDQAENAGKTLSKKERRQIAQVINAGTGRGDLPGKTLQQAAPLLTAGLFSPRLIASRLRYLDPTWYMRLSGPARREAMESAATTLGAGTAVLWLASQIPGVDVGLNPTSSDFGKIRVGDTRIDIWGGFQQYVVNAARFLKEEKTSSTTGETYDVTKAKVLKDFGRSKLSPNAAYLTGLLSEKDAAGRPFDPVKAAGQMVLPLNAQTAYGGYQEGGAPLAAATFGLGFVGFGNQTYGAEPKEKKSRSLRGQSRSRGKSLRNGKKSRSKSLRSR
jgi:hypothetical protein